MPAPDHVVTIYTREQCHLCDDAKAAVEAVAARVDATVDIELVDVDTDPDLRAEYGDRVPYVLVDGAPKFKYRVDRGELETMLD
ncbi:glutaredoxin family protein [Halocalculus aciditolerans]|uniref:Thioredoxin family protein n=1 Tax=Halocalculus aciditolerans TaxID=1383812 RepID=A0A830FF97_9EURY|nr:glutaredoxin family protein [Halocalculus aciditolerans]GGL69760.1 thioredoxin family protein [Halocalculus aciditolerans]